MSAFLKILEQLKVDKKEIVVALNGSEILAQVTDITDDAVTLQEVGTDNRYDLHYTQVIMVGS